MPLYRWDRDRDQILNRLRSKATLRICVKLLDEPILIEGWIDHHAKIVGIENLIIADNGSTDKRTLDLYERFSDLATIFQFDGPHNEIHWHPRFSGLFATIKETCQYFSFIDADERLVIVRDNKWIADNSIVAQIASKTTEGIIPTTWLINSLNCLDTFDLLDTESRPRLENNLRWGKPILPSKLVGIQPGMHNVQFSHFAMSTEFGVNFFLLHYTQFPENRISVNRHKLISRGIIDSETSTHEIVQMDFQTRADQSFMRFVNEIKEMLFVISQGAERDHRRTQDCLKLEPTGDICYSNDDVQKVLSDFLQSGAALINQTFGSEPEGERLDDASSLLAFALELRELGKGPRAEKLLRRGMALYPDFLDQYGGPAFRKEMVRTLLARHDWTKAGELCPSEGDPSEMNWHKILFARAFTQKGDMDMAAKWWTLVLEQEPANGEAREFLRTLAGFGSPRVA